MSSLPRRAKVLALDGYNLASEYWNTVAYFHFSKLRISISRATDANKETCREMKKICKTKVFAQATFIREGSSSMMTCCGYSPVSILKRPLWMYLIAATANRC